MRLVITLLLLCGSLLGAWADMTSVGILWPAWRVETSEMEDEPGYPISFMLDGSAASAWVHHGRPVWRKDTVSAEQAASGVGAFIHVKKALYYDRAATFTIDGIGLTNGYAKDTATYWRNNRIAAVHITMRPVMGEAWEGDFALNDTRALQRLSLPRMTLSSLEIEVTAVEVGADNDLCISELALFCRGARLAWDLPPTVLASHFSECCGGTIFSVMTRAGHRVSLPYAGDEGVYGVAFQPRTRRALLSTLHHFYYYDLATSRVLYRRTLTNYIVTLGWRDGAHAFLGTAPGVSDHATRWYRFTPEDRALVPLRRDPGVRYQPGSYLPQFGA